MDKVAAVAAIGPVMAVAKLHLNCSVHVYMGLSENVGLIFPMK